MEKSFTDNEIIKALEKEIRLAEYVDSDYCSGLDVPLLRAAIDLINRYKAEIERLEKENCQFAELKKQLKNFDIISRLKAEIETSCLSQVQTESDYFKIENGKIVFSTNGASDYRREFESLDEVVEELNHAARQILSDTTALCFYRKAMENRCEKISSIPEHEEKSAMGLLII